MARRNLISSAVAAFTVLAVSTLAQAACCPPASGCGGCGDAGYAPAPAASCGTITRTIVVNELVPETYETFRTTYRTEQVQEAYTAYKTECVPETKTTYKTITKLVPECRDEVRTSYKCVPTCETRTVMKKVTHCRPVTTYKRKCVDQGHYECCLVPAHEGLLSRFKKCCGKDDCCDPCPPMKTKKVWVPNKVWVEIPCTRMETYTECVPECVTVTVMKKVCTTEVVKVTVNRCVTECVPVTCTVMVSRCVPYTATRCVTKCVPVTEKVCATRMVCKPVTKTIVEAAPAPVCESCFGAVTETCGCCEATTSCCKVRKRLFGRGCK